MISETTSFPTRKKVGTIGQIGRGVKAIVLRALDVGTGEYFNKWFTFKQAEELGLLSGPASELVVPVESVRLETA